MSTRNPVPYCRPSETRPTNQRGEPRAIQEDIADVLTWLYDQGIHIHGRNAEIEAKIKLIREAR